MAEDTKNAGPAVGPQQLLSDAFHLCAHGIAVAEPATNRLIACNEAYSRLRRRRPEELIGQVVLDFYVESDRNHVRERLAECDRLGSASFEATFDNGADGRVPVQLDVVTVRGTDGRPRWRIATVQDISWRRRAAEELAAQRARLAAIIDSAMDAIISIDDQQRIVMANPAAEEMFRHVNGGLAGRNLDELLPQRLRLAHRGHVQQFTARGTTRRRMAAFQSLLGLRADGSEFPIEASISLVPVAEGNLMTAVVRDVSLQRQLERDILEISESERRRFSGELHDGLGSVLTGLRFMCDAALREIGETPTPLREDLEKIGSGLREVITNVRRIARGLAPLELERDGLEPALRELASHYATFFGIPCHAHVDARAAARLRTEEAAHLYRIAQEGVANAAKHARASIIDLGLVADGAEVVLTIADDGRGPTGRTGKESSGLGLQSMEYRARLLAGAFSVVPRQPRGTLVSCRIRAA